MRKYLFILLVALTLGSCKDDKERSLSKNPQPLTGEDLPDWMTPRIEEINNSDIRKYFYVVKAKYLGEDVYLFSNCCPMCSTAFTVYRIDGTTIANAEPALVKDSQVVWKPEDFVCVISN